MTTERYDWRKEYVLCEHVARMTPDEADKNDGTKHSGFRVCCVACWEQGFLRRDDLTPEADVNGYAVRGFPQAVRP